MAAIAMLWAVFQGFVKKQWKPMTSGTKAEAVLIMCALWKNE